MPLFQPLLHIGSLSYFTINYEVLNIFFMVSWRKEITSGNMGVRFSKFHENISIWGLSWSGWRMKWIRPLNPSYFSLHRTLKFLRKKFIKLYALNWKSLLRVRDSSYWLHFQIYLLVISYSLSSWYYRHIMIISSFWF